ncbi:MAG: sulfatase-like hydrolase/transferase [Planctomycetes bacterium]|nr:sulfatase-like hydrolase/transferase [Planctomycetota bacterium]
MTRQPNIILIMTDQQQVRASGREGFPLDTTPCQDRLAAEGRWFDRAYTAAPICLPARVSLMTGRFPSAHHCQTNQQYDFRATDNLPELLQRGGYATALVGKNHSHLSPNNFDHYFELTHGGGAVHRHDAERECDDWVKALRHGVALEPAPFPVEATIPARAVTETCRWIDTVGPQPFFVWLSIPEPHNPYYVPEPYYSLFDPADLPPVIADAEAGAAKGYAYRALQELEHLGMPDIDKRMTRYRANYCGMLRLIDDQIGRLISHLDSRKLREDTLFIYVSDHGDYMGDYGLMRKGAGVSDSLMRIPFICSGAGVKKQGRSDAHVSLVDVLPTLCEAAGQPLPVDVQGRSLWPMLQGRPYPEAEFGSILAEQGYGGRPWTEADNYDCHKQVAESGIHFNELYPVAQSGSARMLRAGDWKLVIHESGEGELYNLVDDPAELSNRFSEPACALLRGELSLELARRLTQFQPASPKPWKEIPLKLPEHNWYRR